MRRLIGSVPALVALILPAVAADVPVRAGPSSVTAVATPPAGSRWQTVFDQDVRYFSWRSSVGYSHLPVFPALPSAAPGRGSQVYAPVGLRLVGKPFDDLKVSLLVRSGYVWSRQSTPGRTGEASTVTDTGVSAKASYLGFDGLQPFVSLKVNAPTGKTVLRGTVAFARMDADLVDVPTFGEGWNLGPSAGIAIIPTDEITLSLGAGYTARGQYWREGAISPVTGLQGTTLIDPGDTAAPTVSLGYDNNRLAVTLAGSYTVETTTSLNGQPFYKTGDRYRATLDASYDWTTNLSSSLFASYSHYNRNKVANPFVPDLVVEAFNSNSDVYRIDVDLTYKHDKLAIGPTGSYLYRDRNGWNSVTFQFLPAKTRWAAGAAASYAVTKQAKLNARVEHVWTQEGENPDKIALDTMLPGTGFPAIPSRGWLASLGSTVKW